MNDCFSTSHRLCVATTLCVSTLCCLIAASRAWGAEEQPPNIILCMGDDHGWEETGYNGHPFLKTPVLDEMARTGLRLDRFYAAHPTCSPTRGSVLTGRHPNRYGTFTPNCSIRPEEITIADVLAQAGYACGHFGKWHVGPVKASSPTNPGAMGFDRWLSHDNFFELNPILSRNGGPPKAVCGESSQVLVEEAIRFIRQVADQSQPFLAVIWFGSPHEPYSGLPSDLAMYDDLPTEYQDKMVRLTSNKTGRRVERPQREVLQERFAEITAMDRAMGHLRQFLKQAALRDNTVLWYCGDNGTPVEGLCASPFRGHKGHVYEGGIRVPGVVEWPAGIAHTGSTNVNAVTSDMLPTLCALAQQPLPDRPLDGINLLPLLQGEMQHRPQPICFWKYRGPQKDPRPKQPYIDPKLQQGTTPLVKLMGDIPTRNFRNHQYHEIVEGDFRGARVILDNDYKLVIHDRNDQPLKRELFNLRSDKSERKNLVDEESARADRMERQLSDWQQSVLNSLTGADYAP